MLALIFTKSISYSGLSQQQQQKRHLWFLSSKSNALAFTTQIQHAGLFNKQIQHSYYFINFFIKLGWVWAGGGREGGGYKFVLVRTVQLNIHIISKVSFLPSQPTVYSFKCFAYCQPGFLICFLSSEFVLFHFVSNPLEFQSDITLLLY